jgi:hypothetical protein
MCRVLLLSIQFREAINLYSVHDTAVLKVARWWPSRYFEARWQEAST